MMNITKRINSDLFLDLLHGLGQIRWLVLLGLAWVLLFFNLERLDYQNDPFINFSNSAYLTALMVSLSLLAFPHLENIRWYLAAATMYAVFIGISLLFTPERLFVLDVNVAADVIALGITLYILRRISRILLYYELSTEAFVFEKARSPIQPLANLLPAITAELARNRHFNRPMAVIYFQNFYENNPFGVATHQILDNNLTLPLERRHHQVILGKIIANLVYSSDFVVEYADDIVVCLPETDIKGAKYFATLVRHFMEHETGLKVIFGVAVSGEEHTHIEDLINQAAQRVTFVASLPNTDPSSDTQRVGEVLVELQQRIKIEKAATWVNEMPYPSPLESRLYRPVKRLMDIAAIVLISPVLIPVLSLLALAIYLDDGRPIFYMQDRTGIGGKRFKMFKFRSMLVDAPVIPPKERHLPTGEVVYEWPDKTDKDPRITRVGNFIRKTSLDELPQLLNILRGDMSLVGPRPTTWGLDKYTLHQTERLRVAPGLTGLWQVSARESKNFDERLIWDKKYVDKISLTLDVLILWKTVMQVLKKGGV